MAEISNSKMQAMLQTVVAIDNLNTQTLALLRHCIPYVPIEVVLRINQMCDEQVKVMEQVAALLKGVE